jgi:hypothetical protein
MKPFLTILLILFVVIVIRLFCTTEGFADMASQMRAQLAPLQSDYRSLVSFYQSFVNVWEQAITADIRINTVQAPLTSPKDPIPSSSPPPPSQDQLNEHIPQMEQEGGHPPLYFPRIQTLPETLTPETLPIILGIFVPLAGDPAVYDRIFDPFNHAMQYVNDSLSGVKQSLDKALKGGSEGFYASCECSPEMIANAIQAQQKREMEDQVGQMRNILNAFKQNGSLQTNLARNQALVAEMNDIKNKAQSGELLNSYQAPPDTTPSPVTYTVSPKFNAWDAYKRDHPEDAANFAKTSPPWLVPILSWIHDTSANLRP